LQQRGKKNYEKKRGGHDRAEEGEKKKGPGFLKRGGRKRPRNQGRKGN